MRKVSRLLAVVVFFYFPVLVIGAPPASALPGVADHAHVFFGDGSEDCHAANPTESDGEPGEQSTVVFCLHDDSHLPVDSLANSVIWGQSLNSVGRIVSQETQTDITGIALAVITSDAEGTQRVSGCYDGNGGSDCDSEALEGIVTRDYTFSNLHHVHIAFTPTSDGGGDDCSQGPTATSTAAGDLREFVVCAHDSTNDPLPFVQVTPTVLTSTGTVEAPASAVTDLDGRAIFKLTSTALGDSVVSATARQGATGFQAAARNTVTNTWTAATQRSISVDLSPASVPVGNSVNATATLSDRFGNLIPGQPVTMTATSLGSGQPTTSPPSAVTDQNARASFAASSTVAGSSVLTFEAAGAGNVTRTATWTAGPANRLTLAASSSSQPAGDAVTLTATVADSFGNGIGGRVVTLTTQPISGRNPSQPAASGATATSNPTGQAVFMVTSTNAGSAEVTVSATGLASTSTSISWTTLAADSVISEPTATVAEAGQTVTLTASIIDALRNDVAESGEEIIWRLVSGPGVLSSDPSVQTDGSGKATATFNATQTGLTTIEACWDREGTPIVGGPDGQCDDAGDRISTSTIRWNSSGLASFHLAFLPVSTPASPPCSQGPLTKSAPAGTLVNFVGCAADAFGNPMPGVTGTVSMELPSTGSLVTATGESDPSGVMTFTATSTSTSSAPDRITGSVTDGTITRPASSGLQLTWDPSTVKVMTVQYSATTTSAGAPITATVRVTDQFLSPVSGTAVNASASEIAPGQPQLSGSSAQTNVGGFATFTVTSTRVGSSEVTFTSTGASPQTRTLSWTPGLNRFIVIDPVGQGTAGSTLTVTTTLTDDFGNPIGQVPVELIALSLAGRNPNQPVIASSTVTTSPAGLATFEIRSRNAGSTTITATAGPASDSESVTWTPGPIADILIEPGDSTHTVGQTQTLVASLVDAHLNNVGAAGAGQPVVWEFIGAPHGEFVSPTSMSTDGTGRATTALLATATGVSFIRACQDLGGVVPVPDGNCDAEPTDRIHAVTKTWTAGSLQHLHLVLMPPSTDCQAPTSAQYSLDVTQTFVACAHDQFHNPASGVAVTPTILAQTSDAVILTPPATTTAAGRVTFSVTATKTGFTTLTAVGNQGSGTVPSNNPVMEWIPGAISHLHLAYEPVEPAADDCSAGGTSSSTAVGLTMTFLACAHDGHGNPISGVVVTPTLVAGSGTLSPVSGTTNDLGRVSFTVSSTSAGNVTIDAAARDPRGNTKSSASNRLFGSFEATLFDHVHLRFGAGTCEGGTSSGNSSVESSVTIRACTMDAFHNPVGGVLVTPTVGTGVTGTFSPAATSSTSAGLATFTFSATKTGTSLVTATARQAFRPEVSTTQTVQVNWTAGALAHLHMAFVISNPTTCEGTSSQTKVVTESAAFSVCAHDQYDNAVAGAVVTPTYVSGSAVTFSPVTGTTDANGWVNFSATSTMAGVSTFTAIGQKAGSPASSTNNLQVRWNAAAPTHHHVAFGGAPAVCHSGSTSESTAVGNVRQVVMCLHDQFNNGVDSAPNTVLWFVSGTGSATTSQTHTDASGVALAEITSTVKGTLTLEVCYDGNLSGNCDTGYPRIRVTETWAAGAPNQVTLSFTADVRTVNDAGAPQFHALVKDRFGNAVQGATVSVTGTQIAGPRGGSQPQIAPSQATTGADGKYFFFLLSQNAGTSTVTAQIATGTASIATATSAWVAAALHHVDLAFSPHASTQHECTGGPTQTATSIGATVSFGACAHDRFGNPITGAVITPTIQGVTGTLTPTNSTTDDTGRRSFSFVPSRSGSSVITATALKGVTVPAANTITVTTSADPLNHIDMAFTPTVPSGHDCSGGEFFSTGSVGQLTQFVACAHDSFGNPIPNVVVTASVTGKGSVQPPSTATTGQDGRATFSITSTQVGTSTVSAVGAEGSVTMPAANTLRRTWTLSAGRSLSLTPVSTTRQVNQPIDLTATLTDDFQNPVSGSLVTFTASAVGGQTPTGTASTQTTDPQGIARFTVTSTKSGTSTVQAESAGQFAQAEAGWTPGPAALFQINPPRTQSAQVGSPITFVAGVTDQFANPIQGVTVNFTAGDIATPNSGQPTKSTSPQLTNSGGQASFIVTSTNAGTSRITGTVSGLGSSTATATWTAGQAEGLTLEPATGSAATGVDYLMTATLLDEFSNRGVSDGLGKPLVWEVVSGPGSLSNVENTTDSLGQANATFSSPTPGTSSIRVCWDLGGAPVTNDPNGQCETGSEPFAIASVNTSARTPTTLTLVQGPNVRTAGTTHTVTATLRDQLGDPITTPTPIRFGAAGTGQENPSSATVTTVAGEAIFEFKSNKTGTSTVTASAGALSAGSLQVRWNSGPASQIVIAQDFDEELVGELHTVRALVTDQFGNAVDPGVTVTFRAEGPGDLEVVADRFTSAGIASFQFTSQEPGFSDIFGSVPGLGASNALEVEWVELPGYYLAATDGGIFAFNAPFYGSMGGRPLAAPIVGIAADQDGDGYYMVAADGGIFAFNAPFLGSMGGRPLAKPIVGMATDPDGEGYYLVASDGGIFAFNAPFYGSMGGRPLARAVVGMATDPDGDGYWMVASDGGIFAFNAPFHGSMGGRPLAEPVVGMAAAPSTGGYYLVASDGGIFAFNAPFLGSMGGSPISDDIVGMAADSDGFGYWLVGRDGEVYPFEAFFMGSMGGTQLAAPVVGMGAVPS